MQTAFYLDPVAIHLGPFPIRWYGLMYLLAFACAWVLLRKRVPGQDFRLFSPSVNSDLMFYTAFGVVVGGRFGYVLFYGLQHWRSDLWWPLRLWEGGMSFHGGLIGVLLALFCFSARHRISFLRVTDRVAVCVPLGLFFGRIANFVNGELWGRVTSVPWGVVFPAGGPLARHPSQLYEALTEGVLLFILLYWFSRKPNRSVGQVSGLFLVGYGVARIVVESFREPDVQYGYLAFDWLTMGQLLSVPMLLVGGYLLGLRKAKCNNTMIY